jgi:hypothetical protein
MYFCENIIKHVNNNLEYQQTIIGSKSMFERALQKLDSKYKWTITKKIHCIHTKHTKNCGYKWCTLCIHENKKKGGFKGCKHQCDHICKRYVCYSYNLYTCLNENLFDSSE